MDRIGLIISYDNENNQRIRRDFDTVMDFVDFMEYDNTDIHMMSYQNVEAVFNENLFRSENFKTIEDLYKHCKEMADWLTSVSMKPGVIKDVKKNINKVRKRLMIVSDQLSGMDGYEKDMQFINEIIEKLEERFDL